MIGRRSNEPIDVEEELAAREDARAQLDNEAPERIEGERGPFTAGQRRQTAPGAKLFMLIVAAFIAVFAVVFTVRAVRVTRTETEKPIAESEKVRNPNANFKPAGSGADVANPAPAPEAAQNMVVGPDGQLVPAQLDASGRPVIGPNGEVVPAIDGTAPLTPVGVTPVGGTAPSGAPAYANAPSGAPRMSRAETLRMRRLGGGFGGW